MKLRNIELSTYIKETNDETGAALFIVNTMKRNKGQILFSCMGELGNPQSVKIPATWIPVDLTEQAQREKLINSTEFKSLLRKGIVTIVAANVTDEKKKLGFIGAEEALKRPECRSEYEAVLKATGSVAVENLAEDKGLDLDAGRKNQNNDKNTEREASDLALSIVAREEGGEPEDTLLNAFRTRLNEFSEDDLRYIGNNATGANLTKLALENLEDNNDDEDGLSLG